MNVIDAGHTYRLNTLDGKDPVFLRFVKRNQPIEKYPGNLNSQPGTTTQEVLRALIDRAKYVDQQAPHWANKIVISNCRMSIFMLEARAAERHGTTLVKVREDIENEPTCSICGHIQCREHR
jgi:hypothetical protein